MGSCALLIPKSNINLATGLYWSSGEAWVRHVPRMRSGKSKSSEVPKKILNIPCWTLGLVKGLVKGLSSIPVAYNQRSSQFCTSLRIIIHADFQPPTNGNHRKPSYVVIAATIQFTTYPTWVQHGYHPSITQASPEYPLSIAWVLPEYWLSIACVLPGYLMSFIFQPPLEAESSVKVPINVYYGTSHCWSALGSRPFELRLMKKESRVL